MKISKSQFLQILKEEAHKIKQELRLKKELAAIEKELNELNEVHAGGGMAPGEGGVHAGQKKAVFTKKGTHLVEKEADDMEMGAGEGPEMGSEAPVETDEVPAMGGEGEDITISKEAIKNALLALGQQLDLTGEINFDITDDLEGDEMGDGAMSVDVETGVEDAQGAEETGEEASMEAPAAEETGEEQIDECGEDVPMENNVQMEQQLNEERLRWKVLAGIIKD